MTFADRSEAGEKLAQALAKYREAPDTIVLAIPRGGVAVGAVVAKALHLPLDLIVTKKIGAPGNPEFAIGSVDASGNFSVDQEVASRLGLTAAQLQAEAEEVAAGLRAKERLLRAGRPPLDLTARQVILVDDGVATGQTALAAIKSCRALGVQKVVVAIPVGAADSVARLKREADEVVVLSTPAAFAAVGQFYEHFDQVSDREVVKMLQ